MTTRQPLPAHHDPAAAEAHWAEIWDVEGVHHFHGDRPRAETFVIDTPPPTVSGSLHVGHVSSATPTPISSPASAACVAWTSATRWAGTTTASPPSGACSRC